MLLSDKGLRQNFSSENKNKTNLRVWLEMMAVTITRGNNNKYHRMCFVIKTLKTDWNDRPCLNTVFLIKKKQIQEKEIPLCHT